MGVKSVNAKFACSRKNTHMVTDGYEGRRLFWICGLPLNWATPLIVDYLTVNYLCRLYRRHYSSTPRNINMDTTNVGRGGSPLVAPKYDAWFIQLASSEVLLAMECTRTMDGTYRLKKPVRLIVQTDRQGGVQVGFAPIIHFMAKSAQNFQTLDINTAQVLYKAKLSEVLNDGERMARGYHEEVSGIALVAA